MASGPGSASADARRSAGRSRRFRNTSYASHVTSVSATHSVAPSPTGTGRITNVTAEPGTVSVNADVGDTTASGAGRVVGSLRRAVHDPVDSAPIKSKTPGKCGFM